MLPLLQSHRVSGRQIAAVPSAWTATSGPRAETLSDVIAILDGPALLVRPDGRIALANDALNRILQVRTDALMGSQLASLLGISVKEATPFLHAVFATKERTKHLFGHGASQGVRIELEAHRLPERREDCTPLALVHVRKVGDVAARYRHMVATLFDEDLREYGLQDDAEWIEQAIKKLEHASLHDGLTGLPDRRAFDEHLARVRIAAERDDRDFALVILDVDDFKQVNDQWGHADGDQCLIDVAKVLRGATRRPLDLVARIGGEEFAIILHDCDAVGAAAAAESVRRSIHAASIAHPNGIVTVSMGASSTTASLGWDVGALFRASDEALYRSKREGKDRVSLAA